MPDVVTAFLRNRGEMLLVRRSDAVGTYPGRWGGVSGFVEPETSGPEADARREVREETGIDESELELARAGDPLSAVDGDREWTVHPFCFDCATREVRPNEELADWEWVQPTAMRERETVPGLWAAYERVAPGVADVAGDRTHGAAYVSLRALEVLRDAAAMADSRDAVAAVARELRDARPSMVAVANRVNRVLATTVRDPAAVRERAERAVEEAAAADERAAERAADLPDGPVVTLSRSGTVRAALERAGVPVLVGESRPAREGVETAEALAGAGVDATLATDAALPWLLAEGEYAAALVGADAVLADGSVVNKVGTRALALAADREDVSLYAVAARDKVAADATFRGEAGEPTDVYDGDGAVAVENPVFDRTPADLVAGVVTDRGVLDADGVAEAAAEHREHARWE